MAKTNAQAQKDFRAKKKLEGSERMWIPKLLIAKVKKLLMLLERNTQRKE